MKNFKIKPTDKKKLPLKEDMDYKILEMIYELEKKKLNKEQKELVKFLKTQLEDDWRKPLLKFLKKLSKKIM
ncbi:hypothetical protein KJ785_04590 [Patescibacteria group bacterium]|nr:hypothetical protein [Patescibacteria group bacterium]